MILKLLVIHVVFTHMYRYMYMIPEFAHLQPFYDESRVTVLLLNST